jgi:tripartite-type tricarboxylate transporter receptor subunit TctC
MQDEGFTGYEATTWYGIAGPAKLNPAYVKRMNEDMNHVLAMKDVQDKFDQFGAEDGGGTPEKFDQFMKAEAKKWAKVCKDANVKLDS